MKISECVAISAVTSVLFKFVFAGLTVTYGSKSFTVGGIDAATVAAILTPCLGAVHLETFVGTRSKGVQNDKQS